jgi:hypothetical protein
MDDESLRFDANFVRTNVHNAITSPNGRSGAGRHRSSANRSGTGVHFIGHKNRRKTTMPATTSTPAVTRQRPFDGAAPKASKRKYMTDVALHSYSSLAIGKPTSAGF